MMLNAAVQGYSSLLTLLATAAARSLILALGAGLGLAAFRVRHTAARSFTWTAVLYAALAMPLGWLLPPLPVPAPAFLHNISAAGEEQPALPLASRAPVSVSSNSVAERAHVQQPPSTEVPATQIQAGQSSAPFSAPSKPVIPWKACAIGVYVAVTLILLARFVVGVVLGLRLIRNAREICAPRVCNRLASRARASGLAFIPQAAESEWIAVPVTMGVLRSRILLPEDWREWDNTKLDAVIAHEVSHVARRDALTQRISLFHCAIFWFSPLAWWLDRNLASLAEQASDEAALWSGSDRNDYARTLLEFFEALQTAPGRVWWQDVSMAKPGQAEQRLEKILTWRGSATMGLKKSIAVVILALAVPAVYLTAAVHPVAHERAFRDMVQDQEQAPPPAPSAGVAPPASAPVAPGSLTPPGAVNGAVSTAPIAPVATVAPPAAWSGHSGTSYAYGYSHGLGQARITRDRAEYVYDDDQRFVIVYGKSDSLTMSGTSEDAGHVERLRKQIPGDFIWFSRDEKSYIIRDQATIDRARQFWAPQEELGKKQEELGRQQEALGKQQEELGAKMEKVHVTVPDMTAQLDKLRAELKQLNSGGATMEQIGDLQSEIGELQSRLGEIQSQAGEQQGKLGEQQGALGEKQGKLGEQQGELGRQQSELAEKASRQMKELLDEALKNGTAKAEPESTSPSL
jgi:beta-lactamase regulating signal transducer with metallopeptidase domain/peptidoglycan hydrolase CwlO-like protein